MDGGKKTIRVKSRETRVNYQVLPWNTKFNRESAWNWGP